MNAGVALRLCTESAKTIRRQRRFEHSMSPRLESAALHIKALKLFLYSGCGHAGRGH